MFGSMFAEGDLKVIHLLHEHRPSVFYKMRGKLDEHIAYRRQADVDFPEDRAQLEGRLGCKFVFHGADVGNEDKHYLFKAWRSAVYCDGDVDTTKQMIQLLDGFVYWYSKMTEAGKQ